MRYVADLAKALPMADAECARDKNKSEREGESESERECDMGMFQWLPTRIQRNTGGD